MIAQSFEQSRSTYGSPRVQLDLREGSALRQEPHCQAYAGERSAAHRSAASVRTTESRHHHKIADNWLAKVPTPDRPGQIWQSDITYIETAEGWLYLAFTLDACSRRCIAHHCREDMLAR